MGCVRWRICFSVTALVCALLVSGCKAPPSSPKGAESTTTKADAELSRSEVQATETTEAPTTREEVVDDYKGREGALTLAGELRIAASKGEVVSWLSPRVIFPFDVDGKVSIKAREELEGAITQHMKQLTSQLERNATCVVISRQDLLDGKPWPYLDKLGERPPRGELERDLNKLGLKDVDWLVNCFHERALGILIVVDSSKGVGRIKGLRT